MPKRIGVITSDSGAAIHDIVNITSRRYPLCELILFPSAVQGEGAAEELMLGLDVFQTVFPVDVIILGRGGGSMEDLWCFNDERLARAVAACRIPVVSAVGHESDFTICDFVADLRAPTPSGAAELTTPDVGDLRRELDLCFDGFITDARNLIDGERESLAFLSARSAFRRTDGWLKDRRDRLDEKYKIFVKNESNRLAGIKERFAASVKRLNAVNPLGVLERGFAYVTKGNKNVTADGLKKGDVVDIRMKDGSKQAEVL